MTAIETTVQIIRKKALFKVFTWFTRILLAIAFIPSGITKLLGQRFTSIGTDNQVGFFFEALFQTGLYWNFLGFMQLLVAFMLLIPKTSFFGSILYLPIVINIFIIVTAMGFNGTPVVAGLMLLANIYLLIWEYHKLKKITVLIFSNRVK